MRRGLVYNLLSNIIFFVGGYALHFFLGNTMSAAHYGIVGTITTILDFEYMFVSNGSRQSLAREISKKKYNTIDLVKKTFLFQLIIIAFFFAVNFFGAPYLARILNDQSLTFYFKVASFLIPANGIYVMILGINDGLQEFGRSAFIGAIYPIIKLSAIPFILFVFDDSILGMQMGFLTALIVSIAIGLAFIIKDSSKLKSIDKIKIKFSEVAHNTVSFSLFFIVVSLVLSIDTLVVKSVVANKEMAGYYTGAVNFAKLSYFLLTAFFTIILPVVSSHLSENKINDARKSISESVMLIVTFIFPISLTISAGSGIILSAFYSQSFLAASTTLMLLSLSHFFMGVTVFFNMVITATGNNRFSNILSFAAFILIVPAFIVAAKLGGINYVAFVSILGTFSTMLISYVKLSKDVGSVIDRAVTRVLVCGVVYWIILKIVFSFVTTTNLIAVASLFIIAYLFLLAILQITHVINIKSLISKVMK